MHTVSEIVKTVNRIGFTAEIAMFTEIPSIISPCATKFIWVGEYEPAIIWVNYAGNVELCEGP